MQSQIKRSQYYPYSIEKVWDALTNPEALATWLMKTENYKLEKGQEFKFITKPQGKFDGIVRCKILDIDRPNKIEYSWEANGMPKPTIVQWKLVPKAEGTVVHLHHHGFMGFNGYILRFILGTGWRKLLGKQLMNYLIEEVTV